jgi:hypothetical protein
MWVNFARRWWVKFKCRLTSISSKTEKRQEAAELFNVDPSLFMPPYDMPEAQLEIHINLHKLFQKNPNSPHIPSIEALIHAALNE